MDKGFEFLLVYNDADMLELRVSAWNGAFGGQANVYVPLGHLDEIAHRLRGFPERARDTRELGACDALCVSLPEAVGRLSHQSTTVTCVSFNPV